ncbi:thioredoxin-disulfide reductase [Candidatus Woesearchaeota archaeon]|jgi:thioredoxin-disulfide reductase|nr:thioredoxin-disulfide reductase [Candidatus Woesearchaeota archaeon]MBT4631207.1 thioredoxin-disulfide reductase [Candidatus Woesearchaeota archaeon]
MKSYDVLIIGGGSAGLTAAIYTCRKKLKTAIISADWGGQTLLTNHIENYPGFDLIPGPELMSKFRSQAEKFGAELITKKVSKIEKNKDLFQIETSDGEEYTSKAVILGSGKTPRRLGIPGEDKFFGKGVSTCATCDAPFFHDKNVAIIGGGNSALEAAELLSKIAKNVYLTHRSEEFRADEVTVEKVRKIKNINFLTNKTPLEIKGDKFVTSLMIEDVKTKEEEELLVDGIFVEIGYELDTDWVKHLVKRNKSNEIIIDDRCRTSQPGFFAAGDVSTVPYKQTVISAGEGAKAGLESYKYIKGEDVAIDWK